jgi:XTP/dITP diphosphohydrolase
MTRRLVLLLTSPRLPGGLLTATAWDLVRAHPVLAGGPSPLVDAVRAAGVAVREVGGSAPEQAAAFAAAGDDGPAVWLAGADEASFVRAMAERVTRGGGPELEVVYGSWDPPGARLLDVVAVMDRLRSPGGCPWDARQTHESLKPYLLEEAYEAYDALLDGDAEALREELGDVLLQVVFHARMAQERVDPTGDEEDGSEVPPGFTIDDVAGDLVAKLVRRHPHVFAGQAVSGAGEVMTNWERSKVDEKRRTSALDGVARSQPSISLAAKYLSRAERAGLRVDAPPLPSGVDAPVDEAALGDLLLALVADAHRRGLDAEAALRGAASRFAERVRAAERAAGDRAAETAGETAR